MDIIIGEKEPRMEFKFGEIEPRMEFKFGEKEPKMDLQFGGKEPRMELKIGDIVDVRISAMGNDGAGIAEYGGYTVFVPFVVEGERAKVKINYVKKTVAYGDSVKLVEMSADRVVPVCGCYTKCGGCSLSHMSYEKQLEYKKKSVAATIKKLGGVSVSIGEIVSSKPYGYRNKLQFPVQASNKGAILGFYKRDSHFIVEVESCPLQSEKANHVLDIVRRFMKQFGVKAYDERAKRGLVRHIVCRYIQGQLLLTAVINGDTLPESAALYKMLKAEFPDVGLFVNINKLCNNVILNGASRHLYGIDCISGETSGVRFRLGPDSFFQVNDSIREKLYADVTELALADTSDYIIDAFSGTGVLTAVLAKSGKPVYGIEIDSAAHADALKIKELNRLENMHCICGDFFVEAVKLIERLKAEGKRKFTLVMDPARKGVSRQALDYVKANAPDTIIYVSCNAATLARDLAVLCATATSTESANEQTAESVNCANTNAYAMRFENDIVNATATVTESANEQTAESVNCANEQAAEGADCVKSAVANVSQSTGYTNVSENENEGGSGASYEIAGIKLYDQFAQTVHVEAVVRLKKR
ncbi:MAG: 23S rRNA (uracil(1939)-C(5))-methyltransferase RlmD [Clostridia bacterium]|nr:23S rRNA (uracil(1939)-C(5))-methyltransferase RlmD [Clostridia bacterium]